MISAIPEDTDAAPWEQLVRTRAMGPAGRALRAGDEREQRRYLAALLLGDDLVKRAFGWDPAVRGR